MTERVRGELGGASRALAAEEEIIQWLRNQQQLAQDDVRDGGGDRDGAGPALLYEDADFPAEASSLYLDPSKLPDYALGAKESSPEAPGDVAWHRPTEYTEEPAYFTSSEGCGVLREGALQDAWLLGVLAAVALHPDNLIENLFVSESLQAFRDFGVFTCRFYKDDVWVPVTTDTRVPYSLSLAADDRCSSPGAMAGFSPPGAPLYGSSADKNEVFIPFLEKAYAKLHGSYQVLDERHGGGPGGGAGTSSGRILEAFLDCTGGSAHRVDLQLERSRQHQHDASSPGDTRASPASKLWRQVLRYQRNKCVLTTQLRQLSFNAHDVTALGLVKNRQYMLLYATEVALPASGSGAADGPGAAANSDVLRLVKLKTVWGRGMWKGEWSNDDSKWEEHTQVEQALRRDPLAGFSRAGQDGCFWMRWEELLEHFSELFVVHVLASAGESHQYSVKGEWLGVSAAGAPTKAAHDDHTHAHGQEAGAGSRARRKETAIAKTRWAWLADGEPNWHRNPQFKLSVPLGGGGGGDKPVGGVLLSLAQRDFRLHGGDNYALNLVLLREKLSLATAASREPPPLWELKRSHVVAEAHSCDASTTSTSLSLSLASASASDASTPPPATPSTGNGSNAVPKALPERELVKEDVTLAPGAAYYLVPYTTSAKVEMEFFLRVVAPRPLCVERVPAVLSVVRSGRWRAADTAAAAADMDACVVPGAGGELANAGGPLLQLPLPTPAGGAAAGQENAAWCTNPQFWVRFAARSPRERRRLRQLLAARAHVTLKLVLRKTSHRAALAPKTRHQRDAARDRAHLVGLTAVRARASCSTATATAPDRRGKPPRTDFLGERVASPFERATALSRGVQRRDEDAGEDDEDEESASFPPPKLVVAPDEWCRLSSHASAASACLFLRELPKDWLEASAGLLVVPSLGEPGAEGAFELQVDCDVPLLVDALPRGAGAVQSVTGAWTAATAGGCHLHADWRRNPRFSLHLQGVRPATVRVTLSRSEREWKARCQRDPVASMMGFYVFRAAAGGKLVRPADAATTQGEAAREPPPPPILVNGRPWSETDFVPLHAVSSPPELVLPAAAKGGYVILPATYEPGQLGRFVLSVQCDTDFALTSDAE